MNKTYLVAAYGSLKKGFRYHNCLGDSPLLGSFTSEKQFTMYDLGAYPAITKGYGSVLFEVYQVNYKTLMRLYTLEGYKGVRGAVGNLYDTMDIVTPWGTAEIFYMTEAPRGAAIVANGIWSESKTQAA